MTFDAVEKHVANVQILLGRDDEHSVIYAALEIRMAIESLFYALLPQYEEEIPEDLLKQWQPRAIIDAIIDCNPLVQWHSQVTIGRSGAPPGSPPLFVGQQHPISRELLRKYYHRLGSYLHARRDGSAVPRTRLRSVIVAATQRVEEFCRGTSLLHNMGLYISIICACGRVIKRNALGLGGRRHIRCPASACGAIYDLISAHDGLTEWAMRSEIFTCACKHQTKIGVHLIADGAPLECSGCGAAFVIRSVFVVHTAGTADPPR
jgi:hypothetical protein